MSTASVLSPDSTVVFELGFRVYHFNLWADFDARKELRPFFSHLDHKELFALKPGDTVWIDEEPYHPQGKVYGYTKRKISSITEVNGNVRITFGGNDFMTFSPSGLGRSITQVHNERALKSTLDQLSPFATQLR